jgi:hypothetical protein
MTSRLSQGQMIAAVAAVALLVATFLPWLTGGGQSINVWKGSTLDIYLFVTAVVALLPALLAVTDSGEEFSFVSAATFLFGVMGAILVAAFLTIDFPDGPDRGIGSFIALAAVLAIAYGGFRAMQEEVAGEI